MYFTQLFFLFSNKEILLQSCLVHIHKRTIKFLLLSISPVHNIFLLFPSTHVASLSQGDFEKYSKCSKLFRE